MEVPFLILCLPIISFAVTYALTPQLSARLQSAKIVGLDLHRKEIPKIPAMGGLAVFLSFAVAFTFSGFFDLNERYMFAMFLSASFGTTVGALNDLLSFGKKETVMATLMIGAPIAMFRVGSTIVYSTPLGPLDLGWVFWALVPFGFSFLTNAVNIYAGFNGLEAGLGFMTSIFLGVSALLYGSTESALALLILAGSLLAFLRWNFHPAKTFIGDCGTYLIGAVFASAVIVGAFKIAGAIAFIPYVINFLLRARGRFSWTVGTTDGHGKVVSNKIDALWAVFIHKHPLRESQLVVACICLQTAFGIIAVLFSYFQVTSPLR